MTDAPRDFNEYHAAILRNPEDDGLRRGLAKLLYPIAPELSELITMQLERAHQERHPLPGHTEPSATERALLARHEADWTRLVGTYAQRRPDGRVACTFHRGMIAHAVVEPEAFIEHAAALLAVAPIRHVDFAPPGPGVLPRLLASPALARLDSVGFIDGGLDDAAVAAIAACPHLASCVYLDLSLNRLGPPAFAALAASPHLRALLVVERAQQRGLEAARTWHPGERVIVEGAATQTRATRQPMHTEGRALEASHGYLPWLHVTNRVPRFDARWFVDHGHRPVAPAGTAVAP